MAITFLHFLRPRKLFTSSTAIDQPYNFLRCLHLAPTKIAARERALSCYLNDDTTTRDMDVRVLVPCQGHSQIDISVTPGTARSRRNR